jgi:hypothetical protein
MGWAAEVLADIARSSPSRDAYPCDCCDIFFSEELLEECDCCDISFCNECIPENETFKKGCFYYLSDTHVFCSIECCESWGVDCDITCCLTIGDRERRNEMACEAVVRSNED